MKHQDCIAFLQWSLPRLGMRWAGFRKVRKTVCKRVARRMTALGVGDVGDYRAYLETHPDEWLRLDGMCRIPISRFWRDRGVFEKLANAIFPELAAMAHARGASVVHVWSAGSASGEEPYSLRIAWDLVAERAFPSLNVRIIATEIDETMLARAASGLYSLGSLHDLPPSLVVRAFESSGDLFLLKERYREGVALRRQDIRTEMPRGSFDLVLCRNLVFTYFDEETQARLLGGICDRLRPGGFLVIGAHEELPANDRPLIPWSEPMPIYQLSSS